MIIEGLILYGLYRLGKAVLDESNSNIAKNNSTSTSPPTKAIVLAGRTGVGKSSTANALMGFPAFEVGSTHGTTTGVIEREYRNGYGLRDTPGLLDEIDYSQLVLEVVKHSEIVIYTTVGQLYRKELEFIQIVSQSQPIWDSQSNTLTRRKLALFVNQQDVAETTKPTRAREVEKQAVLEQVSSYIIRENILFGSASPRRNGVRKAPQITELQGFLNKHINL